MSVWLIGSRGMLAQAFINFFRSHHIDFIATAREQVDITDRDQVLEFAKSHPMQWWINCAAYTHVDNAEKEQQQAYESNALAINYLCQTLSEARKLNPKVKLIHFSTDFVFDGLKNSPYQENDPCFPINVYGKTKLKGEKILVNFDPAYLILRISWVFGEGKHFVKKILELLQSKSTLEVVHDQIGSPSYTKDIAEAAWAMKDETGIYHLCNHGVVSRYEFAKEIRSQANQLGIKFINQTIIPTTSDSMALQVKRPLNSMLCTSKIAEKGIKLRPWQEALNDYLKNLPEIKNA
jgi:dTDP-4-dehydrorhamnose reductase